MQACHEAEEEACGVNVSLKCYSISFHESTTFEYLNLKQDPYGLDFPEKISVVLAHEEAESTITMAFNRRGNLIAGGTLDGKCVIWDMQTQGVSLILEGQVQALTSVRF
jgi:hypothetical protein